MEVYQIIVFWVLVWVLLGTIVNCISFPRVRGHVIEGRRPLVSVLVPARNEERNIGRLIRSLKAQDYRPIEVIVLDDRSEDGTVRELEGEGVRKRGEEFRYIEGLPLPEGWVGKQWACSQLVAEARGEWLLFTDADTEHLPGSVSSALGTAVAHRADLLSAWPGQVTGTWSEKWVIPLLYVLTLALLPMALVRLLQRYPGLAKRVPGGMLATLGVANGQYMFFRRTAYMAVGGHAAVRGEMVEDVALGRLMFARTGEGVRVVNGDGSDICRCRMYCGLGEVWEGFSKNLRPVFAGNVTAFVVFGLMQSALFILPFVFALLPIAGREWAIGQVGVVLLIRALLTFRFKTSWWSVVFHPFAYILSMLIALNSWRWFVRGKIRWKGRTYGE